MNHGTQFTTSGPQHLALRVFTTAEVAQLLRVSPTTVRTLCRLGELQPLAG